MQVNRVALTPTNYEKLSKLSKEYKIPVTTLCNVIINEKIGDKTELLKEFSFIDHEVEVKFKINDSEKNYLLNSSKQTGTNSLTQEIRYRLLNSIHDKRFLTPKELESFIQLKSEINMIGKNINQLLKKINSKEEPKIDDLKITMQELNIKLDETKEQIENSMKYTNSRFKKGR